MKVYKSEIVSTAVLLSLVTVVYFSFIYLFLYIFKIDLPGFKYKVILGFIIIYFLLLYVYLGITSNNIIVFENYLQIQNNIPGFRNNETFYFDAISIAIFKDKISNQVSNTRKYKLLQLMIKSIYFLVFPLDLKSLRIETTLTKKTFFLTIESDYYENETGLSFHDLFTQLDRKNINSKWA